MNNGIDQQNETTRARLKLMQRFGGNAQLGGKGTARRKRVTYKTPLPEDARLMPTLKRLGMAPLTDVEEVVISVKDGPAIHFQSPKVHGCPSSKTYAVFGNSSIPAEEMRNSSASLRTTM